MCRECVPPPYYCLECKHVQSDWPDYCPKCGRILSEYEDAQKAAKEGQDYGRKARAIETATVSAVAESVDQELIQGKSKPEIEAKLVEFGFDPALAQRLVDEVAARTQRDVLVGLGAVTLGVVVTAGTYSAASGGGIYLVWFGPIIYGLFRLAQAGIRTIRRSIQR